ncbi:hypothetical protein HanHA300_Chr06g0197561 [Helianthus annuus]|nr:hypothetical protein HanHA300_Chr06g0197561 [Helianthus annuus]KAJ0736593.1 hypothetical protein HanLR1_Chr06g0197631 [Helianthus annuus]
MVHPPVNTTPVKHMPAIRQPPDLISGIKLIQTHSATLRRVHKLRILHHWKHLTNKQSRS